MQDNNDFIFVGGEGDEPPEEVKEILRKLISGQLLGQNTRHEVTADLVNPNQEQYDLGPGDHCLVILGQNEEPRAVDDTTYTLVKVLDPEQYADEFPDWETRLMNSYVLGMWYGAGNDLGELGWYGRVNLMKIEPWQWDAVEAHNTDKKGLEMPCQWLIRRYGETIDGLRLSNPNLEMPSPIYCGTCSRPTVMLKMRQVTEVMGIAGFYPTSLQGKKNSDFYMLSENELKDEGTAALHCISCDAKAWLDLDETDIYFNTRQNA